MTNLTPELIAKAKAVKSAEELLELAKENGVEITEAEAKTFFEQLHTNGAVSDDELEAVAGGGSICEFFEDIFIDRDRFNKSCYSDKPKTTNAPDNQAFDRSIAPPPYDSLPYDANDKNQIKFL